MNHAKSQHFIPNFYLKFFSKVVEGDNKINVYVPDQDEHYKDKCSTKTEAKQKNLYDKHGKIDALFDKHIESKIAILFRYIVSGVYLHAMPEMKIELACYINFQRMRVPRYISFVKRMAEKSPASGVLSADEINDTAIAQIVDTSIRAYISMLDLKLSFVENNTSLPFCISDNPVLLLNQAFFGNSKAASIDSLGLITFLPVSPFLAIMFYDSEIYNTRKHQHPSGMVSHINKSDDISLLNAMQAAHCEKKVFYKPASELLIEAHLTEIAKYRKEAKKVWDNIDETDAFIPNPAYFKRLHFINPKKHVTKSGNESWQGRKQSEALREVGKVFFRYVDQGRFQINEFHKFMKSPLAQEYEIYLNNVFAKGSLG